jgi:hypothetical protein
MGNTWRVGGVLRLTVFTVIKIRAVQAQKPRASDGKIAAVAKDA